MTPRGGAREGAGRPPRIGPRSQPIWCGQMAEQDRALILEMLTPDERYTALMDAVAVKGYLMEGEGLWERITITEGAVHIAAMTQYSEGVD